MWNMDWSAISPIFAAASSNSGISLWTLLTVTLAAAAPLLLAALGGLFSERSGIINIGLEGMMLVGAFVAGWVGFMFPQAGSWSFWLGFFLAGLAGALLACLHAAICINLRTDQIISGIALNILALQSTTFLSLVIFGGKGGTGLIPTMPKLAVGPLQLSPFLFAAILTLAGTWWVVFRTPFGLRLRACGEYPDAVQSAGISVAKTQAIGVLISGFLAGLGGAILVHEAGNFGKDMTAGRGYIALAALIFGGWKPIPVLFACLLFGFAYALNFQLQTIPNMQVPTEWINMLPYILTILALCGLVGRSRPPAALGQNQ